LQDVHDRALFYYRLLQHNVSVAESVVNPPKQAVSVFADTQSSEVKDRIFDEFNSLSVVYQKVTNLLTYPKWLVYNEHNLVAQFGLILNLKPFRAKFTAIIFSVLSMKH